MENSIDFGSHIVHLPATRAKRCGQACTTIFTLLSTRGDGDGTSSKRTQSEVVTCVANVSIVSDRL